jgi:hypothetical protein
MPKAKSKRTRRISEDDLDDMAQGAAEAIGEQMIVQQFNALWSQMETAPRLELELLIAAAGAVGNFLVAAAEALKALKKGKAPTMTIGAYKTDLLRAACDFAKRGTYKKKRKSKTKKAAAKK